MEQGIAPQLQVVSTRSQRFRESSFTLARVANMCFGIACDCDTNEDASRNSACQNKQCLRINDFDFIGLLTGENLHGVVSRNVLLKEIKH